MKCHADIYILAQCFIMGQNKESENKVTNYRAIICEIDAMIPNQFRVTTLVLLFSRWYEDH